MSSDRSAASIRAITVLTAFIGLTVGWLPGAGLPNVAMPSTPGRHLLGLGFALAVLGVLLAATRQRSCDSGG